MNGTTISEVIFGSSAYQSNCLFSFLGDGYCNPSLVNSPSYLDLGGALAAFGLIFAVYQLRKPKWDVVLRIRSGWQGKLFWVLGAIGLALILVRALITQVPTSLLKHPWGTPLLYEALAYLFFIASPLSLIFFANRRRGLFKENTARKFYEVMVQEIAQADDERLNAAVGVLLSNFEDICKAASEGSAKSESRQSAIAILEVVLSDASVVKLLTTKRLDALQNVLHLVERHSLSRYHSGIGMPRIMQNLLCDENSFLHKQYDESGLALSYNVYETIFSSPVLLTNFDLFDYPALTYSEREKVGSRIGVFIKVLSKSIETYLKTGNVPARHINSGISYLSDIFGEICSKIRTEEGRGVDTGYSLKSEWWTLHDIARFLGHGYVFLAYQEELNAEVVEREKHVEEADFHSSATINAGIAAALYKGLEHLSHIEKKTDVYHTVLQLFHGMVYEYEYKTGYRPPFEKRVWEQIAANVVGRYYPATLKTYLTYIGFALAADNERQGWVGEQVEKARRLLYVDLKPLFDQDTKMVNDELMKDALLPQYLEYENGEFTYTMGFGGGEKKVIVPPPAGSTSAVQGIDFENSRSLL